MRMIVPGVMVCAACLAGCAGSSGSVASVNGGASETPAYGADGSVGSTAPSTAFAPTQAAQAVHSSAATQAADKLTAVARPGAASYRIGPLDALDISVFKVPDLTKSVQVADDGTINYPLIGQTQAAGKTAKELEQSLEQKLGAKYLHDPQVTVLVKEFNSQRVTISGSVKTSGVFAIKGQTSLMQVVAMAGDIDTTTDSGDIIVFRSIDGQRQAARFDIDAIKGGKADDPQVMPGDVIVVDTSATKQALANVMKVLPLATAAAVFSGI
jgi:polysaccharide export outer membrane protein